MFSYFEDKSGKLTIDAITKEIFLPTETYKYSGERRFEHKLRQKQLTLMWQGTNAPICVRAEKLSFTNEIINNLISNSIKFCNIGGNIIFEVAQDSKDAIVRIIDIGVGIPKAHLLHFV